MTVWCCTSAENRLLFEHNALWFVLSHHPEVKHLGVCARIDSRPNFAVLRQNQLPVSLQGWTVIIWLSLSFLTVLHVCKAKQKNHSFVTINPKEKYDATIAQLNFV